MEIACDTGLEILDFKLKIVKDKIRFDIFAKPIDSLSYTTSSSCYSKTFLSNVTKGIALRLRRINGDDDDVTLDKRSSQHQNYLIAREHKPSTVKR